MNRKTLDPVTRRFFFVPNPISLIVENAPKRKAILKYHPTKDLGNRIIETSSNFFIPREDAEAIEEGEVFRLKDLFNVEVLEKNGAIKGKFAGNELIPNTKKIQWVTNQYVEMEVLKPDLLFVDGRYNKNSLQSIRGYVEESIIDARHGEIVQFERFGFVRIEKKNGEIIGIMTHR
jgi:glutamyl-tRNA synthetase